MKYYLSAFVTLLVFLAACVPTPTATPWPSSAPTVIAIPSPIAAPIATAMPPRTPTLTATATPLPTSTPTRLPILRVGGSGQYTTIQSALRAARDGDTVQVAQGIYTENITMPIPSNIRLQAGWNADFTSHSDDNSLTIIDGGQRGRVFLIAVDRPVSTTVVIEGFTIRNGMAEEGGAISVGTSAPNAELTLVLTNNDVSRNVATHKGGGIFIQSLQSSELNVTLSNNTISENVTNSEGGGIRISAGTGSTAAITMTRNIVAKNVVTYAVEGLQGGCDGGGIAAYANSAGRTRLLLTNNFITENKGCSGGGGWVYAFGQDSVLDSTWENNIISGNYAEYGAAIMVGSGITGPGSPATWVGGSVFLKLTNNTISANKGVSDGGIHLHSGSEYGDGGSISLSSRNDIIWGNSDSQRNLQLNVVVDPGKAGAATANVMFSDIGSIATWGAGTYTVDQVINKDPLFVDPATQNFLLRDDSPVIDTADPNPMYNDGKRPPARGTERGDMGAYGGPKNYDWQKVR